MTQKKSWQHKISIVSERKDRDEGVGRVNNISSGWSCGCCSSRTLSNASLEAEWHQCGWGVGGGNEVNAASLEARKDLFLPIHHPALTKPFGNDLNWWRDSVLGGPFRSPCKLSPLQVFQSVLTLSRPTYLLLGLRVSSNEENTRLSQRLFTFN